MLRNIEAYRYIKHVLGGELSGLISAHEVLIQAADWLGGAHDWRFQLARTARLDVRGTISIATGTYTHATRTLTKTAAFTPYAFVDGDEYAASGGTGVTARDYTIESRTDDDNIVLKAPGLGIAANGQTDMSGKLRNDSVALPADFLKLHSPGRTNSIIGGMRLTTPKHLLALRTSTIEQSSSWNYFAVITHVQDINGALIPILDIWPETSANESEAFTIFYKRRIVIADEDTAAIPLPADKPLIHTCLLRVCRIFALGYEEGEESGKPSVDELLTQFIMGPIWKAARKQDGGIQPHMGPVKGGAVQSMPRGIRKLLSSQVDSPA